MTDSSPSWVLTDKGEDYVAGHPADPNHPESYRALADLEPDDGPTCSRDGCDSPSIGERSYSPGAPVRHVCAEHDADGRAAVAAYEADFKRRYGQYRSPWS